MKRLASEGLRMKRLHVIFPKSWSQARRKAFLRREGWPLNLAWAGQLRHHRQREIIAIAAFVIGLKGVASDREGRTIRQVGECSSNGIVGCILNDCEHRTNPQTPAVQIRHGELRSIDKYSVCHNYVDGARMTIESNFVCGKALEIERLSDCEGNGSSLTFTWREDSSSIDLLLPLQRPQ